MHRAKQQAEGKAVPNPVWCKLALTSDASGAMGRNGIGTAACCWQCRSATGLVAAAYKAVSQTRVNSNEANGCKAGATG